MKKNTLLLIFFTVFFTVFAAENGTNLVAASSLAPTWTQPDNLKNNMAITASVYLNGILFEPAGLIIGVFKNDICYGVKGITAGRTVHQLLFANNLDADTGYSYKVYDPNTDTYYVPVETVDFANGARLGGLSSPIHLNIKTNAIDQTASPYFSVYPNPVENDCYIHLVSDSQEKAVVELFNIQGRLIKVLFDDEIYGDKLLKTTRNADISSGIYSIKANVGGKLYLRKVLYK